MGWMLDQILDWFAARILDVLDTLLRAITQALLRTPDVTVLPQVQALTGRAIAVVDAAFVLAFLAAGLLTMVAGGDERTRYTIKDLIPRCVVGFVAAHFSQLIAARMIEAANAVTAALTASDLDRQAGLAALRTHLTAARDTTAGLLFVVCAALIVLLLAATALSVIVRFAVALVLTAIAPVALACHALPQTDPAARLWWRAYLGVLAVPVGQGFVLAAGRQLLLDPTTLLPLLGLPAEPAGILNLFVIMVLLWTTVRVPSLIRRFVVVGGRGPGVLGAVVRVVVVQQLGRAVPGLRRGVRVASR
jgi:hypothetical protein